MAESLSEKPPTIKSNVIGFITSPCSITLRKFLFMLHNNLCYSLLVSFSGFRSLLPVWSGYNLCRLNYILFKFKCLWCHNRLHYPTLLLLNRLHPSTQKDQDDDFLFLQQQKLHLQQYSSDIYNDYIYFTIIFANVYYKAVII